MVEIAQDVLVQFGQVGKPRKLGGKSFGCFSDWGVQQWLRVNVLYNAQITHMRDSVDLFGAANNGRSDLRNLDQLTHEVRDESRLAEPLADSVLGYSLRRLLPSGLTTPDVVKEVESGIEFEQLNSFLEGTSPSDPFPLLDTRRECCDTGDIVPASIAPSAEEVHPSHIDSVSVFMEDWMAMPPSRESWAQSYSWEALEAELMETNFLAEEFQVDFGHFSNAT
jgi:hypothetical protein